MLPAPLRPALRAVSARLLPWRLASQCEVCRQWSPGAAGNALCPACVQRFAMPMPRCQRCALRLGLATPACGDCQRDPPPFQRTVCAVDYGFPWDRLVASFKFHGRAELARTLAVRLQAAIGTSGNALPDCILPVPLAPLRLQQRGYNQAWELARPLARAFSLPAHAHCLQRHLDTTQQQADLGRSARQRNLRSAFMVDPRQRHLLLGRRVALVDDVMTTGATAREAAATLLRAGAASVDMWVLARTPDLH